MATQRGFVTKIEVGRAGLVTVTLLHNDGSSGNYVIRDLDADPERFNERLSKMGIVRDAMNRAEPVFVEHSATDQGQEIQAVARISRDDLTGPGNVQSFSGFVLDVMVHARNKAQGDEEEHDHAEVLLLLTTLATEAATLNLQAPERLVVTQQLQMLLDAESTGRLVRLIVRSGGGGDNTGLRASEILSVAIDNEFTGFGDSDRQAEEIHGFVESLGLIPVATGGSSLMSNMAHVRFTTAPAFDGPGNTVGLVAYTPVTIDLLVFKNSPAYALFEAGLRDSLRMRVSALLYGRGKPDSDDTGPGDTRPDDRPIPAGSRPTSDDSAPPRGDSAFGGRDVAGFIGGNNMSAFDTGVGLAKAELGLALAAELLAPLASASRGVWIRISRGSLDHGPDGEACTDGVPSSDLTPQSLRDLRIPYPAEWRGLGCFNHGVYRFQFDLEADFSVCVDGAELCLHDAEDGSERFAHACLGGEHEIVVKIDGWRCDYTFSMDIYRLR